MLTRRPAPAPAKTSTAALPPSDVRSLWSSFRRHHRTALRPATLATYETAVVQLAGFLEGEGASTDAAAITRDQVDDFIAALYATRSPGTAHNRYRALKTFFRWLVEEGDLERSPMDRTRPPALPEAPPPVLTDDELRALLDVVSRDKSFEGRRDEAILRLFIDTGIRRAEMAGLRLTDVDLEHATAIVTGKGERTRPVGFGLEATKALDRYIRMRARHPAGAKTDALWIGHKGAFGYGGIRNVVERRARQAGLDVRVYPHLFRHTFNDRLLAAGANESDVMALAGWRSSEMVRRYAAATRSQRALKVAHDLAPGDRL